MLLVAFIVISEKGNKNELLICIPRNRLFRVHNNILRDLHFVRNVTCRNTIRTAYKTQRFGSVARINSFCILYSECNVLCANVLLHNGRDAL